jgi:hypothetical protein
MDIKSRKKESEPVKIFSGTSEDRESPSTQASREKTSEEKNIADNHKQESSQVGSKFWRIISEKKNPAFHLFLYLILFVSLGFLLFGMIQASSEIINRQIAAGPSQDLSRNDFFDQTELSWALAFLVIAIPVFHFLDWLIHRKIAKKEILLRSWVRKVLLYLTLVILVIVLIGASVSLVFGYFDARLVGRSLGRQLAFWLIILFFSSYHFWKTRRTKRETNLAYVWWGASLTLGLIILFWGVKVSDSPQVIREKRADQELVNQVRQEQREINGFYQKNGRLPFLSDNEVALAPEVEYKRLGNDNYELCASFNRPTDEDYFQRRYHYSPEENEKWKHSAGRHCFSLEPPAPNNTGNQLKGLPAGRF